MKMRLLTAPDEDQLLRRAVEASCDIAWRGGWVETVEITRIVRPGLPERPGYSYLECRLYWKEIEPEWLQAGAEDIQPCA